MLAKSDAEFGCSASDLACLCQNANFSYGVRDCADQACSNSTDADTVKAVGIQYCANAGVAVSGISATSSIVSPHVTVHFLSNP